MKSRFRFGEWLIDPSTNSIQAADEKRQMEPRMMDVLVTLCAARGAIISSDTLLDQCWGDSPASDSALHKTMAHLRRVLGDSASAPRYIETIRMRGYRTVAPLEFNLAAANSHKAWDCGSPFRGLLAFDADHTDVFFGRDKAIRKLLDAALAQVQTELSLVLVLGPSGSGKTSVVQAGLLPALALGRNPPELALVASTTFDLAELGEQTLFIALAGALLDLQWEDQWAFPGENAISLGTRLERSCATVVDELRTALRRHSKAAQHARFGLFLDRFEGLFNATRIDQSMRRSFLATLDCLARSQCILLIVACRNDFYPSIAEYPLLTEGKRHGAHVDIDPPDFGDIAQMIRRPAAAASLTFGTDPATGTGLDDFLCASAVGRPDALPLLQYCLQELYRMRTADNELSFHAFQQLGDLEGAIGQRAEEVVLGLGEEKQAALPHIISLLIVLSGDGANVSSQRVPWAALRDEHAHAAVVALVESRLFVSDLDGSTPVFGIAHDAILRRWPRITAWIATHRNALAARSRLAQQAGRWRDEGRHADLLLPPGKLLDEALELQQANVWSLSADESDLIRISEHRVHQRNRLRKAVMSLIVLLAVLACALGVSAMFAKRAAEARRIEAENLMDFMLGDFSDKLRPLGRLDLLENVSGKALQYVSGSDGADLSPAALTLRAKGLQTIAEVSRARGDSKQALAALAKARDILMRQLSLAPTDLQVLNNLGANAYWVARIHKDRSDWQAAETALRSYLDYAYQLNRIDPDNPQWWVEQSYAHNNLGSLALARGKPEAAAPEFKASIDLKRRALASQPDSREVAASLADSYSWLGSTQESLGELDEAETLYAQEEQLVRQLRLRFPSESMWVYRLVLALQHRAIIKQAHGQDMLALEDYEEIKRLFTPLVKADNSNRVWQMELAAVEQMRLRAMARSRGIVVLLPALEQSHRDMQAVLAQDPKNALWTRLEAMARTQVGAALTASGQVQAGQRETATGIAELERLYALNPSDLNARIALAEALLLPATTEEKNQKYNLSLLSCKKVYDMIGKEAPSTHDYRILDFWVRVNLCLDNQAVANDTIARLKAIGYRDTSFIRFISLANKE